MSNDQVVTKMPCRKCLGSDRVNRGELSRVYCPGHEVAESKQAEVTVVEIAARKATEAEVPAPCRTLSAKLSKVGVVHRMTYARAQRGSQVIETVALRIPRYGVLVYRWEEKAVPRPTWRFELALMITKDGVRKMGLGPAKALLFGEAS